MVGGPVLRDRLDREGLLAPFEALGFSDETGWYKPAPEAFLPVLGALGVNDPARAAHVGDRRNTDVAGARALGMRSVRYTGFRDDVGDGPEADVVIASHDDLLPALGLAR
jgi:putative hydrolase of the HAD superfamily